MSLKSKVSISMCLLLAVSICIYSVQLPTVHSWSWGAHRFVAQKAIDLMPDSLDWFFSTYSSTIVSYSTMPDQWKSSDPHEGPRHYYDVDRPNGTLPWTVEDNFNTFVQYLMENDWDHAAQLAGVISHYIADASNPLHGASDYDPGGNHGAFESTVDSHLGEMNMDMSGFVPQELGNVFDPTMQLLEEGYSDTHVLNPYLRSGILWNDEIKNMTENRLRTGAQLLADIWYTGMIRASLVIGSVATLSPHSPIYIEGNDNFILANGVTSGSGTENDPYIIEKWEISAEDENGIEIRDTTAHFIIRNCRVHDGRTNSNYGIYFDNVTNGRVKNATIENNRKGIYLIRSENNDVAECDISNQFGEDIRLDLSNNNSITNCDISYGENGVHLYRSSNNIISRCKISNSSGTGLAIENSSNNHIYHNNFENNPTQALDRGGTNSWDDGYPSGGNYWSDYTGIDNYRGENQDSPAGDGFGDTPYNITGDANQDRYPLMESWTPAWVPSGPITPPPRVLAGVKAGDWIKLDFTIIRALPEMTLPQWMKVEFLSVDGTTVTLHVTMQMLDGTENSNDITVDVAAGGGTFRGPSWIFRGLSGFVIPANSKTGDSIKITRYDTVTIAGENSGTYAGVNRTVVYASFSRGGTQLTCYWDKKTGALVEVYAVSGYMAGTAKTTETNMWQAETPTRRWPLIIGIIILATVIGISAVLYVRGRRLRKVRRRMHSKRRRRT